MCTCRHSSRQQLCYTIGPQWNHCSAVRLVQVCEQFGAIGFTSFDVLKSFMYARTLLQKKETESSVYKSQYILYANFLPETSRMLSPHFSRNNGLGVKDSKYSNGGKRIAQLGNRCCGGVHTNHIHLSHWGRMASCCASSGEQVPTYYQQQKGMNETSTKKKPTLKNAWTWEPFPM